MVSVSHRIRELVPAANAGIVLNFTPVTAVGASPAALDRQRSIDDLENRWYVEPVAGRGYPAATVERLGWEQTEVLPGDLDLISAPIDTLGINYYTRQQVGAMAGERVEAVEAATAMDWEVHPASFGGLLRRLHERHGFARYLITENGAAMPDLERNDGRVADTDRTALPRHASRRGAPRDRGRRADRGLLRLVVARQLRMGARLRPALRHRRGRLRHAATHAQAERALVRARRCGERDPAGGRRRVSAGRIRRWYSSPA